MHWVAADWIPSLSPNPKDEKLTNSETGLSCSFPLIVSHHDAIIDDLNKTDKAIGSNLASNLGRYQCSSGPYVDTINFPPDGQIVKYPRGRRSVKNAHLFECYVSSQPTRARGIRK